MAEIKAVVMVVVVVVIVRVLYCTVAYSTVVVAEARRASLRCPAHMGAPLTVRAGPWFEDFFS